jgi:ABC-type antimicrobial peptide transport system permease subunit
MRAEGVGRNATALFDTIRNVVQSQNSQNVVSGAQTLSEVIGDSLARQRFSMILLNSFAVVALLLASIGIYGVISYLVGQRTHELGIRLALGAQRGDVLRLILSHGLRMAVGGVALGLIAALALTRLLAEMLYGVSATDPATFAVIALVLTMVALVACFVPAWRATRIDPLVALRYE